MVGLRDTCSDAIMAVRRVGGGKAVDFNGVHEQRVKAYGGRPPNRAPHCY